MEKRILLNRIITPDGTVLCSYSRHDYKTYRDTLSNEVYMVDGGTTYLRRNVCKVPYKEASVYVGDSHEKVRECLVWGSFGKSGKEPLKRNILAEMSNEHIKNVLRDCPNIPHWYKEAFKEELKYRDNNNIEVYDGEEITSGGGI